MNLELILAHIQANTSLVISQTLFQFYFPDLVEMGGLLVSETTGSEVDYEIPGRHRFRFQFIARSKDYEVAVGLASQVYTLLSSEVPLVLGGVKFHHIRPLHLPIPYPRPDSDVIEVSVNFMTLMTS
jgi:hypothetical protein